MFSEVKVTEIYCMANDFCKKFTLQQKKYMVEDKAYTPRNKPRRMNDAEIMVILFSIREDSDVSSIITKNMFASI